MLEHYITRNTIDIQEISENNFKENTIKENMNCNGKQLNGKKILFRKESSIELFNLISL